MHTETLTWYEPQEKLPDADVLVLLKMEDADGEPVWPGYLDGEQWTLADGMPAPTVLRWAEMPMGGAARPSGVTVLDEAQVAKACAEWVMGFDDIRHLMPSDLALAGNAFKAGAEWARTASVDVPRGGNDGR